MIKDKLQELVDRQAEDEGLWSVPVFGLQPIAEAELQKALRVLHKTIEDRVPIPQQPLCATAPQMPQLLKLVPEFELYNESCQNGVTICYDAMLRHFAICRTLAAIKPALKY